MFPPEDLPSGYIAGQRYFDILDPDGVRIECVERKNIAINPTTLHPEVGAQGMSSGVIRNVATVDGVRDLAFVDGVIVEAAPPGVDEVDGAGFVAVPRLSDSHLHLDKTLLGETWYPHRPGRTIADRIDLEIAALAGNDIEDTYTRAERLLCMALANGSTRIRSHVDISARLGLSRLEALMKLRDVYRGLVDITFVAFPQEGIVISPGAEALLDAALAMGVEAVGGLDPVTRDGDLAGHLDAVFGLADEARLPRRHPPARTGRDRRSHHGGDCGAHGPLGLRGKVAISHGYCLGMLDAQGVSEDSRGARECWHHADDQCPGPRLAAARRRARRHGPERRLRLRQRARLLVAFRQGGHAGARRAGRLPLRLERG